MVDTKSVSVKGNGRYLYYILMFFAFAIGFNIWGLGSKLQLALLVVLVLNCPRKIQVTKESMALIVFVMLYAFGLLVNKGLTLTTISTHLVSPVVMYVVGVLLVQNSKNSNQIKNGIFTLFIGYVTQAIIVLIRSIAEMNTNRMEVVGLWGGTQYTAIQQVLFSTCTASLIVYFMCYEERRLYKYGGIALFILSVFNSLYFASRSGILVAGISLVFSIVFLFFIAEERIYKKRMILAIVVVVAVIVVLSFAGVLDISSWWETTNLYERLYISQSGLQGLTRFELWETGAIELFNHPFGSDFRYAHNLWIDVGLEAGIIPMIALLLFCFFSYGNVIKLLNNKKADAGIKMIVLCITIAYTVAFSVEPMMYTLPMLVSAFFGFFGAVKTYLDICK